MTSSASLSPRAIAALVAMLGASVMAAISADLLFSSPHPAIGWQLYDLYAQALVRGGFDLPAMDLRYEGHFAPDGTGYLYYGLGPLLTRIPFLVFFDMPTTWISPFSIWFWAVVGNTCFHRTFWLGLAHGAGGAGNISGRASASLAVAVWFASPGLIVVAGGAVYHEPIAMAYALGGGFVLLIAMASFGRITIERAIVPLAVLAGLAVHARPHLAIGYYLAVCLIALLLVRRGGMMRWKRAVIAIALLGLFGGILLAANQLRFGNAATMHGSFAQSELQYSSVFWGLEDSDGPRARAFVEHGRFNLSRIPANTMIYTLTPPSSLGVDSGIAAIERLHGRMIAPTDYVSIHEPKVGLLYLWPAWMVLMLIGLASSSMRRMPALAGLAGITVSSVLLLSYPTITLRYHTDLWPIVALGAVFGLASLAGKLRHGQRMQPIVAALMAVLMLVGLVVTVHKTMHAKLMNLDPGDEWTSDFCLELAAKKGFDEARGREICGI
ncbi:MAG: hypothetical protein P8J20_04065 [Novosphingobium sp.]|nr:hypothetical protein [Novosphingobium sp.]